MFRFGSIEEAKLLCGTTLRNHKHYSEVDLPVFKADVDVSALPDSLDLRDAYPNCKHIGSIRDQVVCSFFSFD